MVNEQYLCEKLTIIRHAGLHLSKTKKNVVNFGGMCTYNTCLILPILEPEGASLGKSSRPE